MFEHRGAVREPGRAVGLARGVPAIIPASSSRRGGAGSLYCRALRRRRGEEPVQNHRIDGVLPATAFFGRELLRVAALPNDKITAAAIDVAQMQNLSVQTAVI